MTLPTGSSRSRRRMVVAFVEVESPQDRTWRHAALGSSVEEILAEGRRPLPKAFHDEGRTPEGRPRYWCAADKPIEDDRFRLAPVHRTSTVPEDAACEECHIGIRDLQAALSEVIR